LSILARGVGSSTTVPATARSLAGAFQSRVADVGNSNRKDPVTHVRGAEGSRWQAFSTST
jgi:hypothetical protein